MWRKRALVTGGAGFIGSHLCERLLIEGYEVVCLDNFSTGCWEHLANLEELGPLTIQPCDVTTVFHVKGPLDVVLHFASPASPVDYTKMPIATLKAGAIGTMHTLDLAATHGARFVLASTSEVYGDPAVHPQPESYCGNVNPVGPRSAYNEAKRFAEAFTTAYGASHHVSTAIARIFNTFGPRMRADDGRVIPSFIHQAVAGGSLVVTGDGSQTRSFCYVDDLIEGIVRLINSSASAPVNLGSQEETSILALARRIRKLAGSTSRITFEDRPMDDPHRRRPDLTLACELLKWSPTVSLDDGLKRTISWFQTVKAD